MPITSALAPISKPAHIHFHAKPQPSFNKNFDSLKCVAGKLFGCYFIVFFWAFLFNTQAGHSQFTIEDILLLKKHGIKSVTSNGGDEHIFEYGPNNIIVEHYRIGIAQIERHYFFNERGQVDSTRSVSYNDDYFDASTEVFYYGKSGKPYLSVSEGKGFHDEVVHFYDEIRGRDSVVVYRNTREDIFGSRPIDSLALYSTFIQQYDSLGRLISEVPSSNSWKIDFTYNEKGQIVKMVHYLGKERNGCLTKEAIIWDTTEYYYNSLGLKKKEVSKRFSQKPNKKPKITDRHKVIYRYKK